MQKINSQTGQTSSCNEVVAFDFDGMLDAGGQDSGVPLPSGKSLRPRRRRFGEGTSKFIGVSSSPTTAWTVDKSNELKREVKYTWQALSVFKQIRRAARFASEIDAALQYDTWVNKYATSDRPNNYDLYGEYWK